MSLIDIHWQIKAVYAYKCVDHCCSTLGCREIQWRIIYFLSLYLMPFLPSISLPPNSCLTAEFVKQNNVIIENLVSGASQSHEQYPVLHIHFLTLYT
jgi:hypothetical protein